MLEQTLVEPATSANLHSVDERPARARRRLGRFASVLALLAIALAIYAPALRDGFVWDDNALILRDPLIRSWRLIGEGFRHFLFTDAAASDFYRPLQRLTYTLDYAAFFLSPAGYHLVSILWHAAAGIAFFFFAEEFLARFAIARGRGIAFFAALIWLVHPVQSAAVVYVSGRADPIAAAFGFVGLYLLLRMLRADGYRRWSFGFGAGVCLLASALGKESGLIFLFVSLVLAFTQPRRRGLTGTLGIGAAVIVAWLSLRLAAEHLPLPVGQSVPLITRPILIARAVAEYAGLLLFPLHLHMERDVASHPYGFSGKSIDGASWRELQTLLGVLLVFVSLYLIWKCRRRPQIFVPLLLAVVCYLPVSGIIPLNATVAEHWLYLPSAFLILAAAVGLESLGGKTAALSLAICLLLFPARTFVRCFDWKDERTFLTRTIAAGGDSARMLINLANLETSEGDLDSARKNLERALEKEPANPLAQLNLATVKMKTRDFDGARKLLREIREPVELRAMAAENLAVLENRETGAVNLLQLRLAARLGPPNWPIEQHYIGALTECGFPDRALAELKSCILVAPYRAESWLMMSDLLRRHGRPGDADFAFSQAANADVHLDERVRAGRPPSR
jgi:tetratricopeptide (TPR) repeat protein